MNIKFCDVITDVKFSLFHFVEHLINSLTMRYGSPLADALYSIASEDDSDQETDMAQRRESSVIWYNFIFTHLLGLLTFTYLQSCVS